MKDFAIVFQQQRSFKPIVVEIFDSKMMHIRCIYTGLEAKVANLRDWSLRSLAQNRPITQRQFCSSVVQPPLAKFTTG